MENGAKIKVICGSVSDKQGPVKDIVIDPEYLDITVPAKTEFIHATKQGHTVFAYVIEGKGRFYKQKEASVGNGTLCLFTDVIMSWSQRRATLCASCSYRAGRSKNRWRGTVRS